VLYLSTSREVRAIDIPRVNVNRHRYWDIHVRISPAYTASVHAAQGDTHTHSNMYTHSTAVNFISSRPGCRSGTRRFLPREMKAEYETPSVTKLWGDGDTRRCNALFYATPFGSQSSRGSRPPSGSLPKVRDVFESLDRTGLSANAPSYRIKFRTLARECKPCA